MGNRGIEIREYWDPDMADLHQHEIHPDRGWDGYGAILDLLRDTLLPDGDRFQSVLDLGARRGGFLRSCLDARIAQVLGLTRTEHEAADPVDDRLRLRLLSFPDDPGFGEAFLARVLVDQEREDAPGDLRPHHLVVAISGCLEGRFAEDLPALLSAARRLSLPWFVAHVTCTTQESQRWFAERGEWAGKPHLKLCGAEIPWPRTLGAVDVPIDHAWQAVSGILTAQPIEWWAETIENAGFTVRWDLMCRFERLRRLSPLFRQIPRGLLDPEDRTIPPFTVDAGWLDSGAGWGPEGLIIAEAPPSVQTKKRKKA